MTNKSHVVEDGSSIASDDSFVINNRQIFFILLNIINHVLILATTIFTCYVAAENLSSTTNMHAFTCTIGYVLLMAEAISALISENTLSFCLSRRGNIHLHWILQVIGAGFSFYGVGLKFFDKLSKSQEHFVTIHAITGLVSVLCIIIVFISGLPALFAASLRKKIKPVVSKFIHNSLGSFCFILGMISQILAYNKKKWLRAEYGDSMVLLTSIACVLITIFSMIGAMRQLRVQFEGTLRVLRS